MGRQLKLNLFIYPGGHHEAAWRHPASRTDRVLDIRFYQVLAMAPPFRSTVSALTW